MGKLHELKTETKYFKLVWNGLKRFEIRLNDRNYKVLDMVKLNEWDTEKKDCTDRYIFGYISCIIDGGQFGLDENYCVFGLNVVYKSSTNESFLLSS